ncbi:MAG: maleylpyruvate isomerase family mycothiol-dependent enzyme [Acidimicrobiia bacterium]
MPDETDPFDLLDIESARVDRHFSAGPDWDRPSRCEGWTTRDMLSHLMGVEGYNRACLDGAVAALFEEAGQAGVKDVESFNTWNNDRYGRKPAAEVIDAWRTANAAFRQEMRDRGRHGTVDSSIGDYPSWLQAFHLAAEYATHGDDIGVAVGESEREARTAWRVVFGLFVLAENDKPVTVEPTGPGRQRVLTGGEEVELSDEDFVEATQARLPADHPLSDTLRQALGTVP